MPYSLVITKKFSSPVHRPFQAERNHRAAPDRSSRPAYQTCSSSDPKIDSGTGMAEACACRFCKRGVLKGRNSQGCFFEISTGRTGCGLLVPSPVSATIPRTGHPRPRGSMSPDRFPSILAEPRP